MSRQLVEKFWSIQNDRDYTKLTELFAEDAVFEDCVTGRFEGKAAIATMMAEVTKKLSNSEQYFEVVEMAATDEVGWARWVWKGPGKELAGHSLYKFRGGKLTYNYDFYCPSRSSES
ncbi:MAG: nuclear transport factor 2 family protein [Pseudomonadota bacterium]